MGTEKNKLEEDYFARLEREERERVQAQADKEAAEAERAARRATHAGRCGKCGGVLTPRDFRGVEIDLCDDCGSVLLDPGELEQLAGKDASGAMAGLAALFRFRK